MLRSKALEMGAYFHKGLILGNMGGTFLSYGLREKGKTSFIRRTFMRSLRDMLKRALEMGNSLHKGLHWGTRSEFVFQDF
jgi:hypothetical protein